MPTAGYAPPPMPTPRGDRPPAGPQRAVPVTPAPVRSNGVWPAPYGPGRDDSSGDPGPNAPAADRWRTAADDGWQRAMAAAEPPDAGTTRSGLPKRVPQAQLVPGGVQSEPRNQNRRTPDDVRGLLSAYHRGVQRGRRAGSADGAADPHARAEDEP